MPLTTMKCPNNGFKWRGVSVKLCTITPAAYAIRGISVYGGRCFLLQLVTATKRAD